MARSSSPSLLAVIVISAFSLVCACNEAREEAHADGHANAQHERPVQSLLQLIVRPEECDGKEVNVGAYIVLDANHNVGFLEYGLGQDDGELHIVDSSPIGFDLDSSSCRSTRQKKERVLAAGEIVKIFSARKAAYGFVRGIFERGTNGFDGDRICDITGMSLLPNSVRGERD